MNVVAIFDLIAFFGFAGSLVVAVVFATRGKSMKIGKAPAALIMTAMATAAFVMFSNFLEHLGVTSSLDMLEDLVGIFFMPLLGYGYYLIWVDERMNALKGAVNSARAEHEMLMGILDSIQTAVVLVDEGGRITFANEYARDVLQLPDDPNESYLSGGGAIVPRGAEVTLDPGVAFDRSAIGRTFHGEPWEYVFGDVRVPLGLSAGTIPGGSVISFMPIESMTAPTSPRQDGK